MNNALTLSVKHRPRLLTAMMRALASPSSRIAFEGYDLAQTELFRIEGATFDETPPLKRRTLAPRLDFVVLPLTEAAVPLLEKTVNSSIAFKRSQGIIHVQVEQGGEFVFAAFDSFQHCWVIASRIPATLVEELREERVVG
jgi:hypothetical protein